MRFLYPMLVALSFVVVAPLTAADSTRNYDYDFNQDRMLVDQGEVFLISTFSNVDGITVYNFNGQRLWETRFNSKIMSWSVQQNVVLVFSKARDGHATFLTCLDRHSGRKLWERP